MALFVIPIALLSIKMLTILLNIMFFAPMGRFQLELIYLYFPPSSHLVYLCFCLRPTGQKHKYTRWDDGGK